MKQKQRIPTVSKYTQYEFDADARLIFQGDYYQKRDRSLAAVRVDVRFPIKDNASIAALLQDIAGQIERKKAKR
mgnify:CR=1 FL=1